MKDEFVNILFVVMVGVVSSLATLTIVKKYYIPKIKVISIAAVLDKSILKKLPSMDKSKRREYILKAKEKLYNLIKKNTTPNTIVLLKEVVVYPKLGDLTNEVAKSFNSN